MMCISYDVQNDLFIIVKLTLYLIGCIFYNVRNEYLQQKKNISISKTICFVLYSLCSAQLTLWPPHWILLLSGSWCLKFDCRLPPS